MKQIVRILNNLRLAAFPIAYGLTGALIGGTLNRILIAEMAAPATLVAFLFAVPLLVSPIRIWLGYRSDGYPVFGRRREPYIALGGLIIGAGILSAALVTAQTAVSPQYLAPLGFFAFALYGIGRNLGHNSFQALLSDRFSGHSRARAMTLFEVATLIGLVMGSGIIGKALEDYQPAKLMGVATGVATAVLVLAVLAAIGQEPRGSTAQLAAEKARSMPFKTVLKEIVLPDRQIRTFFFLVVLTFIGTLAQDVLLEPYGALVLNLSVAETSRLTAFWGVGVMISMILSGLVLLRMMGYMRLMRVGIGVSILVFIGLIFTGISGGAGLFRGLVLVMGLGTGLAGAGMLAGVINFTTPIRAGMLMGVWGVANLSGHAFGSLMGGAVVDLVRGVTGSAFAAYSAVFALEAILLLTALALSTRLDPHASLAAAEEREKLQIGTAAP